MIESGALRPVVALCGDDTELGQVRAQRIDGLCTLPHEQVSHAVLHELCLLLGCLYQHRTDRLTPNGTADAAASTASFSLRLT